MTAYAIEAEVEAVLVKDGLSALDTTARAQLTVLNGRLGTEIDNYTRRVFTNTPATTWTRDTPYGPLLLLPDFTGITSVTAYGSDVTASVIKRTLVPQADGPPWQALLYAPLGVPTNWGTGHLTSLNALVIVATAGYPAPPDGVVQAATRLLCRLWRARINLYADTGGDALSGLVHSAAPLLDDTALRDLAAYVRPRVPTIVSA